MPSDEARPALGHLWLIPGHLGEPTDVTYRAVDLLDRSALWVIEPGSHKAVDRLVRDRGISRRPVAHLDEAVATDPELLARVLEVLQRGEDVAFFGVDEGIVGWGDPGSSLVADVERALGASVIRTTGGASVVGTALMRLPVPLHEVLVFWPTHRIDERTRRRLQAAVWFGAQGETASLWLVNGKMAREIAGWLSGQPRALRVRAWLLGSLTCPDERVLERTLVGGGAVERWDGVDDEAPCVLVLRPGWHPDVWRPPWFRLSYLWWRARVMFRS